MLFISTNPLHFKIFFGTYKRERRENEREREAGKKKETQGEVELVVIRTDLSKT